ncbi:nucleotidyltransferase domain-containing protein [Paenibacillus sp. IB182496]|uniref:Nucleotidyltransferase domain-containing protein n=2 Tax=Paenibacillus sabuli TaxID=2772509 RepID=A0A927BQ71_9BACL|nr:nucleotidyltransferase domain-containing protein [Paenibacillus sabuli]
MRADSDVDLAFISEGAHTPYRVFEVAAQVADCLKRDVDLVEFLQASTVFQAQVVGSGELLLDEDPTRRSYLFMQALKAYAMLNEERHEILVRRGFIKEGAANGCADQQDGHY